jgi:hypothetical protein
MGFDWSRLREPAPTALVQAREVAHFAVQWVARAARANLRPELDDSHSALTWDAGLGVLLGAPLPKGARVGVHLAALGLVLIHDGKAERMALDGCTAGMVNDWLDLKLEAQGLERASQAALPYEVAPRPLRHVPELAGLAHWFGAAEEVLEEVRGKTADIRPGPSPVRCWPHHFDMAVLVRLEKGPAESARSIGVGISPGDGYYPQPYAYISPYPAPTNPKLPALPPGGHWHKKDFFAAVATAEALLAQRDPRAALVAVIDAAFEAERRWLRG